MIFDEKTAGPDDGAETETRSKLAQKSAVELPEESMMEVDQDDEAIEFIDVIKNLGKSSGADKTLCNNFIELTKAEQKGLKSLKTNCEENIQQIKAQNCVQEILSNRLKLQHLFKCMCVTCSFTSDSATDFKNHLIETHAGKKLTFTFYFYCKVICPKYPKNTNET